MGSCPFAKDLQFLVKIMSHYITLVLDTGISWHNSPVLYTVAIAKVVKPFRIVVSCLSTCHLGYTANYAIATARNAIDLYFYLDRMIQFYIIAQYSDGFFSIL